MLIQPFILGAFDEIILLSHRELRRATDGYGVVRYKRRLNYVTNNFQVILDGKVPPQDGSFFLKDHEPLPSMKPNQTQNKNKNNDKYNNSQLDTPDVKFLKKIAFDGISEGFLTIKMIRNFNEEAMEAYSLTEKYRPRYRTLSGLNYSDIKSNLDEVKLPNAFFQDLDIKFFSYPYNNWQFLRAMETLHSFKLKDYLNGNIPLSKDNLKKINEKSFNEYLRANIFFQHCIYCEGIHDRVEDDILEYIDNNVNVFNTSKSYENELAQFLTEECKIIVENWRSSSIKKMIHLCSELPRWANTHNNSIDLLDEKFPLDVKQLSIYSIAHITHDKNMIDRIQKLHKFGIRKIGHISSLL
jgi:hypothetical protein